jgi:hypothetical protein
MRHEFQTARHRSAGHKQHAVHVQYDGVELALVRAEPSA